MACSHSAACPLFPLLNSSLEGWRRCYCDSQEGWRACARFPQSLRGQYVPLSLLPNGHDARHLQSAAAERGSGGDAPPQATGSGPSLVDLLFEQAPPPSIEQRDDRRPGAHSPSPQPPATAPRYAREPSPIRSWWNRLAEWMRTPA